MKDRAKPQLPLSIDRIESARADADTIRLRLIGRWLDPSRAGEEELLVVQVEGRRHRFAATRDPEAGITEPHVWSATFSLPAWAEPRYDGQAALWLGSAVIPVAPPRGPRRPEPAPPAPPPPAPPPPAPTPPPPAPAAPAPAAPAPVLPAAALGAHQPPRSGPLADLLLKETVSALHAELEQRTADAARMQGGLADAQSELEARTATQAALEAAQGELRLELERLRASIADRRIELEEQASQAHREREAWSSKVEAERAELGRQLADLAAERDERSGQAAALREQLAAAQAAGEQHVTETARLREDLAAANVARDAAVSEAAGLRAELERIGGELAATRERVGAETGNLGEANRLLADARALADQLRGD